MSTPISSYSYTIGPTGIKTGSTEQSGLTVAWSFDGNYRLTGETVTAPCTLIV
ncbi:MAG TPA: hypothetical protein VME18_10520 [Acidobacteriaceae bacterium]|nr:hypothetical protein [Acidobacteriaceae bacterium]